MPQAKSADGKIHDFPDDTPSEVIDRAMKDYAVAHTDKSSFGEQYLSGLMDPIEGGAQMLAKITPKPVEEGLNAANNWLAEKTGLVSALPPGGMDEHAQQREQAIAEKRGGSKDIDWGRMAGNILNPMNFVMPGLGAGGGLASSLARASATGGAAAMLQPATSPDFWTEKAMQGATGAAVGTGMNLLGRGAASGARSLGEYVGRNYPENVLSTAVQKIIRRVEQDNKGASASDTIDLVNAAQGAAGEVSGKPLALVDVAGPSLRGLAGNVARVPGESKSIATSAMNARDEEAAKRLSQDIEKYVSGGQTMHQATEALLQSRSAASRPVYDQTHALQGIWSPRLAQFLEDPAVRTGLQRGYEIERLRSLAEGRPLTATQMGVDLSVDGSIKILQTPNMRLLDMAKQGLDAMIADERHELTGRLSARGVALDQMRRAYVDTIDTLDKSGIYKKARDTWAGYSASLDALRLGRSVFRMSPEESEAAVAKLSPGNREFLRMGVADMLKERLAKTGVGGDEAKAILKNPWVRDQLKPVFKSADDFNKFVDSVAAERQMFGSRQSLLGGSQTAERLAEDGAAQGDTLFSAGRTAVNAARGHWFTAAKNAWNFYKDVGLKPNAEVNAKIAEILFTADLPPHLERALANPPKGINPLGGTAEAIQGIGALAPPALSGVAAKTAAGPSNIDIDVRKGKNGKKFVKDPSSPTGYSRVEQAQ